MVLVKKNNEHIKSLDGIRGLAIIMVLFAHFSREDFYLKHYPLIGPIIAKISLMGLMGVSLFFVLSGLLITGILLNAKANENYFKNFYARRTLRIFPLYYLVLIFIFTLLPLLISFSEQSMLLKKNQAWLYTYLSNFPLVSCNWNVSKQFALGHFWSLSVEEHFYLLWPLIVYLTDIKMLKKVCNVVIIISLLSGIFGILLSDDFMLFKFLNWTTITFSGALALGALLAVHKYQHGSLTNLKKTSYNLIWIFGILFLIIGFIPRKFNPDLRLQINHEVSWFFFTGLIIYILNLPSTSILYKAFTNKLLLLFGKISYGIYIFHGLLLPFFEKNIDIELIANKTGSPILGMFSYYLISIGTIFIMSWLSWTFIESQILRLKLYFE